MVTLRQTEYGSVIADTTMNPGAINDLLADTLNQFEFTKFL